MDEAPGNSARLPELFTPSRWVALGKRFRLSKRQKEIARLICLGYSNTAIGKELGLRPDTVRMHNRELFKKLAIHQRIGVPVRLVIAERSLRLGRSDDPP